MNHRDDDGLSRTQFFRSLPVSVLVTGVLAAALVILDLLQTFERILLPIIQWWLR